MKRLVKRMLCFVLAFAMLMTMSAFSTLGQSIAMADTASYKLYFKLPDGTSAGDWGVNSWTDVTVEGNDEIKIAPKGWGKEFPSLLTDEAEGFGYVTVSGNVQGLQFVNKEASYYDCWNSLIASENHETAYFVPDDAGNGSWYSDLALTNEIKVLETRNIFYVAGAAGLVGENWNPTAECGKMTQDPSNENIFSITFNNVKKGSYEYKILQDPERRAWSKTFGGDENRKLTVDVLSNVTLTIDISDAEKNVTVTTEAVKVDSLKVSDQVRLSIDGNECPLSLYNNGVYELSTELAAGEHTTVVTVNNDTVVSKKLTVAEDTNVIFRYTNDGLANSVTDEIIPSAAFVGNFEGLEFVDENGERYDIAAWKPADKNAELDYVGGGIYKRTFTFNELKEDLVIADGGYKVAFNDGWGYSIGNGNDNIALTIPAGSTELTIVVDELNKVVYDSVRTAKFVSNHNAGKVERNPLTTKVALAGSMNGWPGDYAEANSFTIITPELFIKTVRLAADMYNYKVVFDGKDWFENGDNKVLELKAEADVVIVYNAAEDKLYDSVNDANELSIMLGMASAPAVSQVVDNKNGTTTFVKTATEGDKVKLFYADADLAKEKGADAFTAVDLGTAKGDSVKTGEIFFGDAALNIVYYYDFNGYKVLDDSANVIKLGTEEYSLYTREAFTGREVNVPGTFPGPSWDASSNVMTYAGNGLYYYTFKDVPAANYEYKISFHTWAENYGVGGVQDGSNYSISVPTKQDVTVYYTDINTHLAVNSLNYKFITGYIDGEGIEKVYVKDDGLTGVYSATVNVKAGKYSNVNLKITEVNFKESDELIAFPDFELEEDKEVTFYYAPDFGIAYNNAAEWSVDKDTIKFDSKNIEYKNPYGAVEEGEAVAFAIEADDKVTDAKLVIKGATVRTIDLEKKDNKWTATTSFDTIGEYDYFFVLYSGSAIKVYSDDSNCDYGLGTVTDLSAVTPYDLVVYKNGFKTPDWVKNAVIYQIFPDRFYNGDITNDEAQTSSRGEVDYEFVSDWYTLPENPEQEKLLTAEEYAATGAFAGDGNWSNEMYGGDLKGITERIGYLKALGVNVIYLNPVFSSISSHRYDATDYKKIDPILGTEGDFAELVKVAEENDMHIVLDGVFNHVSDDSVYFDRYYKFLTADDFDGKIGAYPYWAKVYDLMASNKSLTQDEAEAKTKEFFQNNYKVTDFSYTEWFEVYKDSVLTDDNKEVVTDGIGLRKGMPVYGYEGWWGYDSMPVIKSTAGSEYQTGNWASEIIEGSNSVTQYWISQGSGGWRLDVANEVSDETWQHFRQSVKGLDSDAVIIGEIWDDATEYLMGDMYDSVMNYIFRNAVTSFAKGGSATDSTAMLERIRERYPEEAFYAMMNLVGSHDTTRLLSYLDNIGDDRNQKDIDSAFPTYEKTSEAAKQKQYLVAFLQFTYAGAPTIYYGDEIGMVGADDPDDRRAFTWGKGNKELVEYYASLAAIRKANPVLRTGSVEPMTIEGELSDNLMAFVRRLEDDKAIVLANNSDATVEYTVDLAAIDCTADTYYDLLSGTEYTVVDGKITVSIPARRGLVLKTEFTEVVVDTASLAPAYDSQYVVVTKKNIAKCAASLEANEYEFDGTAKTPAVNLTDGAKILKLNSDYVVKYTDNINVGTATVTVTGINDYAGKLILNFSIVEKAEDPTVDDPDKNQKQDQVIDVKKAFTKKYGAKKFSLNAKANTALTYKSSNTKVVTVDKKGKVTIKGVGIAKITITAAESDKYNSAKATVKIVVKKGTQKIKVKVASKTIKKKNLKKNVCFKIGAKAAGKLTYKVSKSAAKYIKVDKKGKVTISKNAKKGTYKIKIYAKSTGKYNKAVKTIMIRIK